MIRLVNDPAHVLKNKKQNSILHFLWTGAGGNFPGYYLSFPSCKKIGEKRLLN